MERPSHNFFDLVICVLHFLPQGIKDKISFYLDNGWLDSAFYGMCKQGLFPGWFKEEFDFDPLYSQSGNLRYCFSWAVRNLLMELVMGGLGLRYRLTVDDGFCEGCLGELNMTVEQVQELSRNLAARLKEKEEKKQKPV